MQLIFIFGGLLHMSDQSHPRSLRSYKMGLCESNISEYFLQYPSRSVSGPPWNQAMKIAVSYPTDHEEYLERCHAAGQIRPTPQLLNYTIRRKNQVATPNVNIAMVAIGQMFANTSVAGMSFRKMPLTIIII